MGKGVGVGVGVGKGYVGVGVGGVTDVLWRRVASSSRFEPTVRLASAEFRWATDDANTMHSAKKSVKKITHKKRDGYISA